MRRLMTGGLWVAATAAATALVWTAVSVVAAQVADRPTPVIGSRQVIAALNHPAPTHRTPVSTAEPEPDSTAPPPTSAPRATKGGSPTGGHDTGAGTATFSSPTPSGQSAPPPPTPTTAAPERSEGGETPTTSAAVTSGADPTATFAATGGTVTVACHASAIRLLSASPQNGYQVDVTNPGPEEVEVHFVSGHSDTTIKADCQNGQPVAEGDG